MNPLVRHAVCAALCLASASSMAGTPVDTGSTRPDLFFAWLSTGGGGDPVVANFDRRADFLRLTRHCSSGLPVYSFQRNVRFTCRAESEAPGSPDGWKTAEVTVKGPAPESNGQQLGLFSLKPTRTTRWKTRAITADEQAALRAMIDADQPRRHIPAKQLKLAAATAVFASDEGRTTFIVPGQVVRDVPGEYYAQRHHVFVREDDAYAYRGMIPAKPTNYFDLDGSDLPAILVREDCDGWCVSLWRIAKGVRNVAWLRGH